MNRRLRKDLGMTYNKDSSRVTAHHKVCDEFKKKETSVRNGIVYGECQFVQLPCECTGLVEEVFTGRVPTPVTIPYPTTTIVDGMEVVDSEDHIQFMVNKTFRVKTVSQLEKEKKKVVESHIVIMISTLITIPREPFRGAAFFLVCVFHKLGWTFICIKTT